MNDLSCSRVECHFPCRRSTFKNRSRGAGESIDCLLWKQRITGWTIRLTVIIPCSDAMLNLLAIFTHLLTYLFAQNHYSDTCKNDNDCFTDFRSANGWKRVSNKLEPCNWWLNVRVMHYSAIARSVARLISNTNYALLLVTDVIMTPTSAMWNRIQSQVRCTCRPT